MASITPMYVLMMLQSSRLIHQTVSSPFDAPRGLFSHCESRNRQCLALIRQLKLFRTEVSVVLLAFPLWLNEGSCRASHPICILDRKNEYMEEGKKALRRLV